MKKAGQVRLKRYKREFSHSYAFGVFPTLELLYHRPEQVVQVLLHSRGARNAGVEKIRTLCAQHNIPCAEDDRTVERLEPREDTYALGVFEKYAPRLHLQANHVVLVNPSDMGNLGTILRTMLAFSVDNLALIRPAADIFDPRVVRASMGALFQVAFAYFDRFEEYRAAFGGHALYPFMTDGRTPIQQVTFRQPFALIFGNESTGLPAAYHEIGTSVAIPHSRAVDSLNLAVAVGIALYESTQRRGR